MDKFEAVVGAPGARFPVTFLGNPATQDFVIFDLSDPFPKDYEREITARGLVFLGSAAIVNGKPRSALQPLAIDVVETLAEAYLAHIHFRNARSAPLN